MWAMTLMSKCFLPLTTVEYRVSPLEPNEHGVGYMSLPQSCQADMAFWQNLFPQVLCSPRTSRENGSSLFPIFWATNRTKQICCGVLPKGPSLNVIPTTTVATTAVRPSGRPAVTVPELTGAFPAVWTAISIPLSSTPTPATPGSPTFWHRPRSNLFSFFFFFFFNHSWLSHNLKWDNWMSPRLLEPSKQTVWKFTWSRWTSYWIYRADTQRSDLWVPSLSAFMTQSLSVKAESMGFPIH